MYSSETSEIPESELNWKAPEDESANLGVPEKKKDIEYSLDLGFRSADGNFDVLQPADRQPFTKEDLSVGIESPKEKIDYSFDRLLGGLRRDLHDPNREMPSDRKAIVDKLINRKPAFVGLDKARANEEFVHASETFTDSRPGVILFPESGNVMNQFSAIEHSDGRMARLMRAAKKDNLDDFVHRANLLTPNMEGRPLDEKVDAYAMEFLEGAERPKSVTQVEIDDWLARVKESELIFGFDVSEKDIGLDNFVRKDGKLFWVDGNILQAREATREEDLDAFIETQRQTLKVFT